MATEPEPDDNCFADDETGEPGPYFVEVWNDYDPSQRFAVIFPVGEDTGVVSSSVAYYIIEPMKHTGRPGSGSSTRSITRTASLANGGSAGHANWPANPRSARNRPITWAL